MTLAPARLAQLARGATLGARFLRHTRLARGLRPLGLAEFARALRGARRGPHQVLRLHRFNTPDKLALVFGDARLSYRDLDERINRLAWSLWRLGVGPGDTVGIAAENCNGFIETQMAANAAGAVACSIGYRLKPPEIAYILGDARCKLVVFDPPRADAVREAIASLPGSARPLPVALAPCGYGRPYDDLLGSSDGHAPPPRGGQGAGGVMVYTSGTTGKPKGAHRDLSRMGLDVAVAFALQFPLAADERHLAVAPLYHSLAPAFIGLTFAVGGTVVLAPHFDAEQTLRLLERERCTSLALVPTMLQRILALPPEVLRRHDTSSLRWAMSGSAPLPTDLARRFEERFGPVLHNFYGATETGFVTLALPGEHTARPGTIGRAVPGNQVRLLDDQGRDVPRGGVGELYVRNSMLMSGYYGNAEATRRAQRDGYFSVGDMARMDDDGYLYLAERKADMVISGGVNVYPLEIENCLCDHPAVAECAVVGVPDPEWGEALRAFVVLRPGAAATRDDLDAHCRARLADYKRPRGWHFVDALPRTPTGKVLKRELRARAQPASPT